MELQMPNVRKLSRLLRTLSIIDCADGVDSSLLADVLNVSRRTVFRDIAALRACDVPVHYDEVRKVFCMPRTRRQVFGGLSTKQIAALLIVSISFARVGGEDSLLKEAACAAYQLLDACSERDRSAVLKLQESICVAQEFEKLSRSESRAFNMLQRSAVQRKAVRVKTRSSVVPTLFSPYSMLLLNGAWHAVGRSSIDREVIKLKITEILCVETTDSSFAVPSQFNLARFCNEADTNNESVVKRKAV
jgi:predicted DNA-binding transcriptional regulator YafY